MGFLSGDDDEIPIGKYHESTFGGKVKDDRWDPNEWNDGDDDGNAPWERNSGWRW
jgi:hypothetical protein